MTPQTLTTVILVLVLIVPIALRAADNPLQEALREALEAEGKKKPNELTKLDAPNRRIESLEGIEDYSKLETVNLPGNPITDLTPLAGLRALRHLNLSDCRIRNVAPLARLSSLTTLRLDGNADIEDYQKLAGGLPKATVWLSCERLEMKEDEKEAFGKRLKCRP